MNRFGAVLNQRCPVCLEGPVFRSFLGAHKECPVCGVRFERETGYYLNAMFIAYVLGFLILAPLSLYLYFTGASLTLFGLVIVGVLLIAWPLVFRYSRIIWLHVDQMIDPR